MSSSSSTSALADELDAIARQLGEAAREVRAGTLSFEMDTGRCTDVAQLGIDLMRAVCTPREQTTMLMRHLSYTLASFLFVEWGGFEAIPAAGGSEGGSISYRNLAAKLGADQALISQLKPNRSRLFSVSNSCARSDFHR